MVKRFCGKDTVVFSHSEGHPERFTELHEEEEREGRDKRWAGGEKAGLKRRETDLHNTLFPKCSP